MNVQLRYADGQYVLIDLNPTRINYNDVVCERTFTGYRINYIESVSQIDKSIHRRVVALQESIGIRQPDGTIVKAEVETLKRLHDIEANLFLDTIDEYEDPKAYEGLPLWADPIPKMHNDLYVISYLYEEIDEQKKRAWEEAMLENNSYYDIDIENKARRREKKLEKELEKWKNHQASSWLGKWYRQIRIDKILEKLKK